MMAHLPYTICPYDLCSWCKVNVPSHEGTAPGWDAIPSYSSPYLSVPIYMAEWREGQYYSTVSIPGAQ